MSLDDVKARLKGKSFKDLIKSTKKQTKQRLISDVEFLSDEQYAFLEAHTQQRFFSFMEQYWAEKLVDHEITCTTFEGEKINIDRGSIRVVDRRWKGASHCLCGKAIRYEYFIGQYGPIGSVHICEHTNLDQTLVRDITKGYKKENTLRTEIVRMLADLKENGKTYDDWVESYDLLEKMKHIGNVRNAEKRELIMRLCDLRLPLPEDLRKELSLAISRTKRELRENNPHVTAAVSTSTQTNPHQSLLDNIETAVTQYKNGPYKGVAQYDLRVLNDLANKIKEGNASRGRLNYARSLLERVNRALTTPASQEWQTAQVLAKSILDAIVRHDVKNKFARSLQAASQSGDLTTRQLDCIFNKPGGNHREGLYYQYTDLMNSNNISSIEPESYQD